MDSIRQDVKYALRSLRRGGLLIGIAVLSLGIGIGSVTTIFSAVDVFMLRPLPYPESGDLLGHEPGAEVGRVVVVDVQEKYAVARPTTGSGFERGQKLFRLDDAPDKEKKRPER